MCGAAGLQAAVQAGSSPVQSVLSVTQNLLHAVRKQEPWVSFNFNFPKTKYSFSFSLAISLSWIRKYIIKRLDSQNPLNVLSLGKNVKSLVSRKWARVSAEMMLTFRFFVHRRQKTNSG